MNSLMGVGKKFLGTLQQRAKQLFALSNMYGMVLLHRSLVEELVKRTPRAAPGWAILFQRKLPHQAGAARWQ